MLTRCSRDMRYRFVSESYAAMLGRRPEDLVGKSITENIGEEAFRTILPYVEKALRGERVEYESEVAYRGIAVRTLHVVYTPDKNEYGEVVGWIASILDITDQKQAQERERTLLLEIEHRSNNLLAIVQTIAQRSLTNGQSLDEAKKAFEFAASGSGQSPSAADKGELARRGLARDRAAGDGTVRRPHQGRWHQCHARRKRGAKLFTCTS